MLCYNISYVMFYNICHVMLYKRKYVMLYNICYITCVMLYNMCHVVLYNMCHVMLYNMSHGKSSGRYENIYALVSRFKLIRSSNMEEKKTKNAKYLFGNYRFAK